MPAKQKPNELFRICNDYFNSLIIKFIISISHTHEVDQRLQLFKDHITRNLHPHLIDNLLLTIDPSARLNDYQTLLLLKLLMHPLMIVFNTRFKLPSKDFFYEQRLKNLEKLVVLNLSMVCTDEILKAVGNYCHSLQMINIVSKIGTVMNKSKRQVNALKLMYFVSDEGLDHLQKCKSLKTIIMNKIIRSNCGGRQVTHAGIRRLVRSLPYIEFISYNDMGLVLGENINDNELFSLLYLHDNHVIPEHIDIYNKHCPKIKGLCLMFPPTKVNKTMAELCLTKLQESSLNISSLSLGLFPLEGIFNNYLIVKGCYLTSLSLVHHLNVTSDVIFTIGKYCPKIENLTVSFLHSCDQDVAMLQTVRKVNFFNNLHFLRLAGSKWNPNVILPLCLNNAHYINKLIIINAEYYNYIDNLIMNILKMNPLKELKYAALFDGFYVSHDTLSYLVLRLDKLEYIAVNSAFGHREHLERLIIDHNLRLNLGSDFIIDINSSNYGSCFCAPTSLKYTSVSNFDFM